MSLMHPTLGEMYDRAVVLQLKIDYAQGKDVAHFREELDEIAAAVRARGFKVDRELRDELINTHVAIWDMLPQSPPELLALNARRVALREQIDKLCGDWKGPEKV